VPRFPRCDEVIDLVEDIRFHFVKAFSIPDEEEKKAARLALVSEGGAMYALIAMLDARLGGTWANGHAISVADLYVTCVLADYEQPTFLDGFPEGTFASFPNILKLRQMVVSLPAVVEHYKNEDAGAIRATLKAQ
jgi:glutathione S-transferase